ncbi:acid-sensing ion channel 1 [Plakobranchus ocellatus]|uniref:Acid-sensing ion channel 1 n=1 Tax=Plakobranchus ocellatus TaxID=259542 RepID=A0AAV3Y3K9_9GAST|nr:acid-sensing ion channel 1 [Plakobranchus ocellatus]
MASFKELLDYFAACDLKYYKTTGDDNSQHTWGIVNKNGSNSSNSKNTTTNNNKSNKGGIISVINSNRKTRRHSSIKAKENFHFDYNSRWPSMTEIYGNNPAYSTAGASDVDSNCTTTETTTTTTRRKHRTAKELIHEFANSTSMHGVQHAMAHRSVWRQLVWSVLVIGFMGWAVHNVYEIISDYNSHPFQTSVSSEYQSQMNFPAVTVCNLNRIRLSKTPEVLLELQQIFKFGIDETVANAFINVMLKSLNRRQQREMGHQIQDMLLRCKFGNEICTPGNFTFFHNLQHGNCYTFASSQDSHRSQWLTMRAGPGNGLSMEFNVQFEEYLGFTTASGLKVLIHDNGEVPFPEDGGIMAGTGAATSIAIRKTQIKRLAPPYADCIAKVDVNNKEKNLFEEFGFAYSLNACQKSCVQKHIYKTCQCCDVSFPCIEDALQRSTGIIARKGSVIPICNTTDFITAHCVSVVEEAFRDNTLDCIKNCPPACEESSFSTTVSSVPWPTHDYLQTLLVQHALHLNMTQLLKAAERSFLKLEIYYDSLIVDKVVNQPAFTWNKLLSDIGGQLGLLLGFSILTAVEILELVVMDVGLGVGLRSLWRRRIQKEGSQQELTAPQT